MQFKGFKVTSMAPDGRIPKVELPQNPWASMPPHDGDSQFKRPLTFWEDVLPVDGTDRTSQFKAPLLTWPDMLPTDNARQAEQYGLPWVGKPVGGMSQFKIPPTPSMQPTIVDSRLQQLVNYYADWLAKQAKYDVLNDNSQEINHYIQEATKVVKVGEKEVAMFAPFRPKLSALQTFTTRQVVALCVIGLLWMIGLLVFRLEMVMAIIGAITVM